MICKGGQGLKKFENTWFEAFLIRMLTETWEVFSKFSLHTFNGLNI